MKFTYSQIKSRTNLNCDSNKSFGKYYWRQQEMTRIGTTLECYVTKLAGDSRALENTTGDNKK